MLFAEGFIDDPTFNPTEVAGLIGIQKSVRKLQANEFTGPVAAWSRDRAKKYGETIIPRHMYIVELPKGREHRVAWVFHEGFTEENEPFCMHHVACDCAGDVERAKTPEERDEIVSQCPGLQPALEYQARAINKALHISDILDYSLKYDRSYPMDEQTEIIQKFIGATLLELLKNDYTYPRSWIANIESGWTHLGLVSRVYSVTTEDLEYVAGELEEDGEVMVEGQVISLSQHIKDKIDAQQHTKEVLRGLEAQLAA